MKSKRLPKILLMCLTVFILVLSIVFAVHYYIQKSIGLTTIPIAKYDILPRTKITDEAITMVKVPKAFVTSQTITKTNQIVGRYTSMQGKIPAGSLFYTSMVFDQKSVNDQFSLGLKQGQSAFAISASDTSIASFVIGQRVDIHVTLRKENEHTMTGIVIENARITDIKDHQGQSLQQEDVPSVPYTLFVAVDKDDIPILNLAKELGDLSLFANSNTYDTSLEAKRVDSGISQYLQDYQTTMEDVDLSETS